jgi:phospholipid-binding lipoprotein MlaA
VWFTVGLSGCATPPTDPVDRAAFEKRNDPLEPLNRRVLGANQFLDRILLRPTAKAYVFAVPEDARAAIRRVLDNMKEPNVVFNNVLQGEFARAGISAGRFAINSSVGVAGIIDVATLAGIDRQPADFGQTLFVWGLPSGPYLVLPILGPSNPRDAIGMAVDAYADPFSILATAHGVTELTVGRTLVNGVDERARLIDLLDDLEKNSLDFYAQLRSLSQQHRETELRRGAPAAPTAEPTTSEPTTSEPATSEPAATADKNPGNSDRQTAPVLWLGHHDSTGNEVR